MMAALAAYLVGTGAPARRRGESAARALGAQVAALGLSPAQATEAFLFFRQAITRSVSSRLPLRTDHKLQAIRRVEDYFNRAQVVLMDAYARASGSRRRLVK
jgi:hypothetical protein